MFDFKKYGIDTDIIRESLTRALTIAQELNYRLESEDMIEETRLVNEQARCCFKALAQVVNCSEMEKYAEGKIKPIKFGISSAVEDISAMAASKMRRSRIKISCDVEPDLKCIADPDRFEACLVNLIINALQNVDREEGSVRIVLRSHFDIALVSVIDNGYGMSQKQLSECMNSEAGARGFDILKSFCDSVKMPPVFETKKNSGFSVTVRVPLAPPDSEIELHSDVRPVNVGTVSPYSVLFYKLDEAWASL